MSRVRSLQLFLVVLVLGAALRFANATTTSFHLDDFHSIHHASADGWGALLSGLRADNHPPLSFVLIRASVGVFGDSDLARRLPALLAGVLAVWLTWRAARHVSGELGRVAAAGFVALSSLHLELSSDARMYALLALAVIGLVDAILDELAEGRGWVRATLWTWAGLLTHYHFLHALLVLAATGLALGFLRLGDRRSILRIGRAAVLGAALAAPWYLTVFVDQLGHELPPGGSAVSPRGVAEAMIHLVFHRVSLAGAVGRWILFLFGATTVILALVSLVTSNDARERRADRPLADHLVLGALAFGLPLWTAVAAWLSPRAGFEWRYLAGAIAPFAILLGEQLESRGPFAPLRRGATAAALVGAVWLSVLVVRDPGREDYRSGVAYVLDTAKAGDAVLGVDWQPRLFPHAIGWSYYAPRLAGDRPLPRELAHTDDFALAPGTDLAPLHRVFVVLRSVPNDVPLLQTLRARYPREEARRFGEAIWVLRFED